MNAPAEAPALLERPEPGIACLALNRPQRKNALDLEIREILLGHLESVIEDAAVRAIVIYGKGGTFCAGGDITTMRDTDPAAARARMQRGHRFVRRLHACEKPVVAAVEGHAVGAGAGLALLADSIVMGEAATMGFPFFKIGLIPDWGILHTLPRRVGVGRAKQLLLQARMVKGPEALALGMADQVVPDAGVLDAALAQARVFAAQPAHAFALVKRQLHLHPTDLEVSLETETMGQALSFATADFAEGRSAFLEKRKPNFG
jgi:2-(1,2-epoxy-1,2-dihydrophenyl)acetyl-CoA isomerase